MTVKATLRRKEISGDKISLYLDFYPPISHPKTGKPTRREFLRLYLLTNAKNPLDKQHNKDTLQLAEQIRQKRENQLNKPEVYTGHELEQLRIKEQGEQDFLGYFKSLANKRQHSSRDNWISAFKYLDAFTKGHCKFADLDKKFCNDFKEFLLTAKSIRSSKKTLARNSAASHFSKLKAALKQAYIDGLLNSDLSAKTKPIELEETRREILTLEELNALANTECKNPLLRRAALFSGLTGLRYSDIENLAWRNIEYINNEGYILKIRTQKTKSIETVPISEQAYGLLGEPKEPTGKVFKGLVYSAHLIREMKQWIEAAGITKKITFHCFRHTYATLQLSKGTDITTVQKMLSHKDLKTTMIYAKVLDKAKREAAGKIQLVF